MLMYFFEKIIVKQYLHVLDSNVFLIKVLSKSVCSSIQSILDATVLNYERFRHVTSDQENLRLVDIQNWAGLGAVQ